MEKSEQLKHHIRLPHLGMRIIKSALAVFVCFFVYHIFQLSGSVLYALLAALWCIQPYWENTLSSAGKRIIGTLFGSAVGLILISTDVYLFQMNHLPTIGYYALLAVAVVFLIYITVLLKKTDTTYYAVVVFLSIVIMQGDVTHPFLLVAERAADTLIGIAIGMFINRFDLPRAKRKDTLFLAGMDDVLFGSGHRMPAYSVVEMNRMIEQGAQFSIISSRTPANLQEVLGDIHLKLPVIAMEGAVMYDVKKREFVRAYVLSTEIIQRLKDILDQFDVNYYLYLLLDHTMIIQYKELKHDVEKDLMQQFRSSPYRNYTQQNMLNHARCVYLMTVQPDALIQSIRQIIEVSPHNENLRLVTRKSEAYPGYSYLKVFNRNAHRENMIEYLLEETKLQKAVTFGNPQWNYDVSVDAYDNSKIARTLKRLYEPFCLFNR